MTTIHDITNTQTIVDKGHSDLRRACAIAECIIDRFRFEASRPVTAEEVNGYFREAADGELQGILGYEERPLVSADYTNDPRSSIIDALSTMVIDDTQVKIYAWYDNEWGYVNRMMELAQRVARSL